MRSSKVSKLLLLAAAAALVLMSFGTAMAAFPEKDITIVVPFGDSSGTNAVWRAFGAELEKIVGVKIIYENQSGAAGSVGTMYFMNQPHDGYTLLGSSDATTMFKANQLIDVDYDDLAPLALVSANCGILVTYPGSPLDGKSFAELIDYIKAHPGEVTVGSSGIGSMPWIWWTLLKQQYGIEFTIVDYDGSGEANTQLMGKHIDLFVNGFTTGRPLIEAGSLKAICVFDTERLAGLPDVPAISEATKDFDRYLPNGSFFVIEAHADAPADVVAYLRDACMKTYASDGFQKFLAEKSGRALGLTGDEANAYMKHQQAVNSYLLFDGGISTVDPSSFGLARP